MLLFRFCRLQQNTEETKKSEVCVSGVARVQYSAQFLLSCVFIPAFQHV